MPCRLNASLPPHPATLCLFLADTKPTRGRGVGVRSGGPTRTASDEDVVVGDLTGADDRHRYVPAGHFQSFSGPLHDVGVTRMDATAGSRPEGRSKGVGMRFPMYEPRDDDRVDVDGEEWVSTSSQE